MPDKIRSTSNRWIKWVKRLQSSAKARNNEKVFVLEGRRLAQEALEAELPIHLVLHDGTVDAGQLEALAHLGGKVLSATDSVLKACADTRSPPGLLVVAGTPDLHGPDELTLGLVIDRVSNPGNLGSILRSAQAVGVQEIMMTEGTVDAYNPKVVRGAMGAHMHLPFRKLSVGSLPDRLHETPLVLADAHEGISHTEMDWRAPVVLAVAGETEPASDELISCVNERVRVIYPGNADSLNAAVAISVILFEVLRQRGV
jgi:TrmH family RNA methyltransferase